MNITVKSYVVLGSIFLLFSANLCAKQPAHMSATPVVVLFPYLADNPDFFDLTAEQKQQIAMIGQQSGNLREGLDQTILDLRAELREEMLKFSPNQKELNRLRDDLLVQEKARLQLSITCAQGLRKALTKDQWKTLLELATQ
jgi:hypothetical protein